MRYPMLYLLPEIFVILFSIFLIIFLAILLKRTRIKIKAKNRNRFLTLSILKPTWFLVFILTIIYFLLIFYTPPVFTTPYGLYSNVFVYYLRLILSFTFLIYMLYIKTELKNSIFYSYEFLIVLLLSFVSLNLILISSSILNIFIFVELFSLCSYYLIVAHKNHVRSLEAGMKYFIFGSLGSITFLFGLFLLYYSTGLTNLFDLYLLCSSYDSGFSINYYFVASSFLITTSLLFKLGAGFYYFWLIDVYDGINYPMLILLNIFAKVTYIYLLFAFLYAFNFDVLNLFIKSFIIFSLFVGAFGAIYQIKIKKFLIFTSLYNISFFSVSLWSFDATFKINFLIFSFLYILNTMVLIIGFSSIKDWNSNTSIRSLTDLPSLSKQNKAFAYLLIFILFTSAGLPPLTIFFAKFFIFFEISRQLFFFWLFLFILASTFAFFYYIRVIKLLLQKSKIITFFLKPLTPLIAYLLSSQILINILIVIYYDKLIIFLINFF